MNKLSQKTLDAIQLRVGQEILNEDYEPITLSKVYEKGVSSHEAFVAAYTQLRLKTLISDYEASLERKQYQSAAPAKLTRIKKIESFEVQPKNLKLKKVVLSLNKLFHYLCIILSVFGICLAAYLRTSAESPFFILLVVSLLLTALLAPAMVAKLVPAPTPYENPLKPLSIIAGGFSVLSFAMAAMLALKGTHSSKEHVTGHDIIPIAAIWSDEDNTHSAQTDILAHTKTPAQPAASGE